MNFLDSLEEATRPDITKKPWMNNVTMELVTAETIERVIDECIEAGLYALDLETTGLDNRYFPEMGGTKDKIVGACLSPDGKRGYYIPVRHMKGEKHNLPLSLFNKEMARLIESEATAIFHNAKFDQEFLQHNPGTTLGVWDDPLKFEDTLILAWLRNTRERNKGLKHLSKVELDKEMIELEDLFGKDEVKKRKGKINFAELDPSWDPCIWYACSDAICTYQLFKVLQPQVVMPEGNRARGQEVVYRLEKMCLPATRWMERCRVWIDPKKVNELIQIGQIEYFECITEVYDFCNKTLGRNIEPGWVRLLRDNFIPDDATFPINKQIEDLRGEALRKKMDDLDTDGHYVKTASGHAEKYDILSREQLGYLFEELKIPDLRRTEKSEQIMTTQSEIDRLNDKYGHRYPFLPKIKRLGELQKALGTYLISLHRDVGPDGTLRVNYNQLGTDTGRFTTPSSKRPEIDGGTKYPMHGTPATYQKKRPQCLLRIREAIMVRDPDWIMAACFAKGSLVSTARGLIPVEDVTDTDQVLTESGYKQVKWSGYTGTKPTVTVRTNKGFHLRVTRDHRILVAGDGGFEWKEAGDLVPGDWVCQATGTAKGVSSQLPDVPWSKNARARAQEEKYPLRVPRHMSEDLAEFLGRFLGDGSISHDKGEMVAVNLALGSDIDAVLPHVNRAAKSLFDREFTHRANGDVSINSRPLCRWLNTLTGKAATDVHDLSVPECVLQGGPEVTAAFLRGLFDADGSVSNRGGDGVRIWISSSRMAQQVQLLLLQHGVQAKRVWVERETNFGRAEGWEMSITGIRNLERFRDRIGMASPRKTLELDLLLRAGRNRDMTEFIPLGLAKKAVVRQRHAETNRVHSNGRRKGRVSRALLQAALSCPEDLDDDWMEILLDGPLLFDTVKQVTNSGTVEVYDVSVPDGHRLQVSGILAHNCDFGGVELRIATILSGEPKWLAEYFRCSTCGHEFDSGDGTYTPEAPPAYCPKCGDDRIGDLHTLTAITFYGEERMATKEGKGLRQGAKSANFAMAYGGGPSAIMRAIEGCSDQEAARHHRTFNETYGTLKAWWDQTKSFGRKHGYVATAFGRHYPLPDIRLPTSQRDVARSLKEKYEAKKAAGKDAKPPTDADVRRFMEFNRKFKAKAERNATNGPIQGLSADITKLAMALIYREVKKREWFDKVRMIITIHDELVFEVHKSVAAEALELFQQIMTRNKTLLNLKWRVPLTTDCEIGPDWTVPYDLKDFKYKRVRPDGFQTDEKGRLFRDKETGKLKAKQWPAEYVKIFGPVYGYAPVVENLTEEEGKKFFGPDWQPLPLTDKPSEPETPLLEAATAPQPQETASEKPQEAPSASLGSSAPEAPSAPEALPQRLSVATLEKGETFQYRLRELGVGVAEKLARVIVQCQGRGSHPLHVIGPTGESVLWEGATIRVNPIEFETAASYHGI